MDDKQLMENLLLLEKGACDLFMHGAIESSTDNVHKTFNQALTESICMQDTIYTKMAAKGWYPPSRPSRPKFTTVKQKYSAQA